MVPIDNVLAFAGTVVIVIAIPGPSVLFTISRALTVGRRSTLHTVVGNAAGTFAQVVAVALGMGALVERSAFLYGAMKYIGAAYIVYLGVQAIWHRRAMADALRHQMAPVTAARAVRDGFVVGVTNPKTVVLLVTVMPGFAAPAAGYLPLQLLILGLLLPATALVVATVWAFTAGTARQWFARSSARMTLIGGVSGVVMIGLGVGLALTGRDGLH